MTTLAYAVVDARAGVVRARQRRAPPAPRHPAGGRAVAAAAAGERRARHDRARAATRARRIPCRPGRPSCSTRTGWSSGAASRSTAASSACAGMRARRHGVDALCTALVDRLVGEQRRDDVAVIAARVLAPPERLSGGWPADRESLVTVRHELRRWLAARGAGDQEVFDVTVAVQEACANAVEHAYRPGPEAFALEATCEHRRRPRRRPRLRPLAPAAGHEPGTRDAPDERADGFRRHPPHRARHRGRARAHARRERPRDLLAARVRGAARGRRGRGGAGRDRRLQPGRAEPPPAGPADQPQPRAGGRPLGDDLPRQRGHQPLVRSSTPTCASASSGSTWSCRPAAVIGRAIAITGLDVAVPAHPTREAALAAARSPDAGGY